MNSSLKRWKIAAKQKILSDLNIGFLADMPRLIVKRHPFAAGRQPESICRRPATGIDLPQAGNRNRFAAGRQPESIYIFLSFSRKERNL